MTVTGWGVDLKYICGFTDVHQFFVSPCQLYHSFFVETKPTKLADFSRQHQVNGQLLRPSLISKPQYMSYKIYVCVFLLCIVSRTWPSCWIGRFVFFRGCNGTRNIGEVQLPSELYGWHCALVPKFGWKFPVEERAKHSETKKTQLEFNKGR